MFANTRGILSCNRHSLSTWHRSDSRLYQSKDGAHLPVDQAECDNVMQHDRQLLSFQQTAELGMHTMQGSFSWLRVPLAINDSDLHSDILESTSQLFNLCACTVGHNQIWTVYMPIWKSSEQEELWATFKSMLFSEQCRNDQVSRFHLVVV
jgi:hypothetical protein